MVKPASFDSNGMKKGAWSKDEDNKLSAYILRYGHWNWRLIPKYAGLARCGKSCRLRWLNYLKPGIKRGNFTTQEKQLVIELHAQLGNRFSAIAAKLPGRTDNEIKNLWHAHLNKRSKQDQKGVANRKQASSIAQEYLEEGEKPSKSQTIPDDELESAGFEDNHFIKLEDPTLSYHDTMTKLQKVDFWPDLIPVETARGQTDYFPAALPEDEFFYSEYRYLEPSSSDSSYPSATSFYYASHESFYGDFWTESLSDASNSESKSISISPQYMGGFIDPCLQYFDPGMDLFS